MIEKTHSDAAENMRQVRRRRREAGYKFYNISLDAKSAERLDDLRRRLHARRKTSEVMRLAIKLLHGMLINKS